MTEGLISAILKAFVGTFLDALAKAFKDWRADMTQRDLGSANQKQADTEAAVKAETEASKISLQPGDLEQTKKDLRNGDF